MTERKANFVSNIFNAVSLNTLYQMWRLRDIHLGIIKKMGTQPSNPEIVGVTAEIDAMSCADLYVMTKKSNRELRHNLGSLFPICQALASHLDTARNRTVVMSKLHITMK